MAKTKAPISRDTPTGSALIEKVTALDRNSDLFSAQFASVLQILRANSEAWRLRTPGVSRFSSLSTPLEEWTLRWLLKKFENQDPIGAESPVADPLAWELLAALIIKAPGTVVARLMKGRSLLITVQQVLEFLLEHRSKLSVPALTMDREILWLQTAREGVHDGGNVCDKHNEVLPARKRKREESNSRESQREIPSDELYTRLYVKICQTVRCIELKTEHSIGESDDFTAEQLKRTLRTGPEPAARLFAYGMIISHDLIQKALHGLDYGLAFRTLVEPFLLIWNSRIPDSQGQRSTTDDRFFCEHALVPVLTMYASISPFSKSAAEALKTQVGLYCITNSREGFLRVPKTEKNAKPAPALIEEAYLSLKKFNKAQLVSDATQNPQDAGNLSAIHLPALDNSSTSQTPTALLFRFALETFLQQHQRRGISNENWVHSLFIEVARCLCLDLKELQNSVPTPYALGVITQMLEDCAELRLSISKPILGTILTYFCLPPNSTTMTDHAWMRLKSCLAIDSSILSAEGDETESLLRGPKRSIYSKVLEAVSAWDEQVSHNAKNDYQLVLKPFVNAFVENRELPLFLKIWRTEISSALQRRKHLKYQETKHKRSIWQDELLFRYVASESELALSTSQMKSILSQTIHIFYESTGGLAKKDGGSEDGQASLHVINSLIYGSRNQATIDDISSDMSELAAWIIDILVEQRPDGLRTECWRTLSLLFRKRILDWSVTTAFDKLESRLSQDLNANEGLLVTSNGDPQEYEVGLSSLDFLVSSIASGSTEPLTSNKEEPEWLRLILEDTLDVINKIQQDHVDLRKSNTASPSVITWSVLDGQVEFTKQAILAQSSIIAFSPGCLVALEAIHGEQFLRCLGNAAQKEFCQKHDLPRDERTGSPTEITWLTLWDHIISSSAANESVALNRLIASTILHLLETSNSSDLTHTEINESWAFYLTYLQIFEPTKFTAEQRVKVIDVLTERLTQAEGNGRNMLLFLDVFAALLAANRKKVIITQKPYILWEIVTKQEVEDNLAFRFALALRKLTRLVLRQAIEHGNPETEAFRIASIASIVEERMTPDKRTVVGNICSSITAMALATLRGFISSATDLLADAILRYLESELRQLAACKISSKSMIARVPLIFENLILFPDELARMSQDTFQNFRSDSSFTKGSQAETYHQVLLRVQKDVEAYTRKEIGKAKDDGLIDAGVSVLFSIQRIICSFDSVNWLSETQRFQPDLVYLRESRRERKQIKHLKNYYIGLSPEEKSRSLWSFTYADEEWCWEKHHLMLLTSLLSYNFSFDERSGSVKSAIDSILDKTVSQLFKRKDKKPSFAFMKILERILQKNAWAVTQRHIDNLLGIVITWTSHSSSRPAGTTAAAVFNQLCDLFHCILIVHRLKLGGRYHLVVAALNGLLRCLFKPYTDASNVLIEQPEWLYADPGEHGLNDSEASKFARLLTTICEPSVASLARPKASDQPLNDQTKKERRLAGEHLQYVILEFCTLQIQGRLSPSARSSLNHGLYSALGAMSRDVMRALNESLDVQGKEVFKSLYNDYQKYGMRHGD